MAATFTVDAYPDQTFTGCIRQVRNAATTVQNVVTYDAVIDVDNPDLRLKPGMTANVAFVVARRSDVLVLAAPQTAETRGLVGAEVLAALPRGAYVINVARGGLADEDALRRALDDGHVAGCALDVVAREPLPAGHPFWRHPRVLVFPHVSAVSASFWERETALLVDNIARYRAGRRLRKVVNLDLGY